MKIVNAVWEKENINENVIEFVFENEDITKNCDDIKNIIDTVICNNNVSYVVVKCDAGNKQYLKLTRNLNLDFMETQIILKININDFNNKFNDDYLSNGFCCKKNDNDEYYNQIISEVKKGIYNTDRIAFDDKYGIEIANKRYANWISDIKQHKKHLLYILYYNDIPIGFHIGKIVNNNFDDILVGLFKNMQNKGFGKELIYNFLCECKEYDNVLTTVSSNNIAIIKCWQKYGAIIEEMKYVFVKHI